jgi:hypothetical protein
MSIRKRRNDASVVGAGGRMQLQSKEHKTIQMVRESVTMTIGVPEKNDTYTVVAEFVFTNNGPACTVQMGFPETGEGDLGEYSKKTAYTNFISRVDGEKVPVKRVLAATSNDDQYDAFWVKAVKFGAKQTRKIVVSYTVPFSGVASPGLNKTAHYDFTGGNWQGKVLETLLTIRFEGSKSGCAVGRLSINNKEEYIALTQKGRTLTKAWKDWQAEGGFTLYFGETPPKNEAGNHVAFWGEVRPDRFLIIPGK